MNDHSNMNCRPSRLMWIDEIPREWDQVRGKRVFRQVRTPKKPDDEQLSATQKYGVVPQNQFMEQEGSRVVLALTGIDNFRHVDKDDFVISLRSFQGGIERCHYDGCVSPAYTILKKNRDISEDFFGYLLKCDWFISALQVGITGIREGKNVSYEEFGDIVLPFPPVQEQAAIARFLDRETGLIDGLIEKKTRFIALLKEKRAAAITHAVTTGIDPDATMRDSGYPLIGVIPEHWVVIPVKAMFDNLDGKRIPLAGVDRENMAGDIPYYGASGIIDRINKHIFDEDMILVSEDGANLVYRTYRISFIARGKYWVNNHAHVICPKDGCLEFWSERLEAIDLVPFITGSTQPKLTIENLLNIRVSMPPSVEERRAIQSHILELTPRIDSLIIKTERSIDLLREKRAALITAAVTGKIDVREAA